MVSNQKLQDMTKVCALRGVGVGEVLSEFINLPGWQEIGHRQKQVSWTYNS